MTREQIIAQITASKVKPSKAKDAFVKAVNGR